MNQMRNVQGRAGSLRNAAAILLLILILPLLWTGPAAALVACEGSSTSGSLGGLDLPWVYEVDTIPPRCASETAIPGITANYTNGFRQNTAANGILITSVIGSVGITGPLHGFSSCGITYDNDKHVLAAGALQTTHDCAAGGTVVILGFDTNSKFPQTYNFEQTVVGQFDGIEYIVKMQFVSLSATTYRINSMTVEGGVFGTADERPLTVEVTGTGSGTVMTDTAAALSCKTATGPCYENVADGTVVTLTATPDVGSTFDGWENTCDAVQSNGSCKQTINGAATVTAKFTRISTDGTVTIIKKTAPVAAGDETFTFSFSQSDLPELSLTTVNNKATSAAVTVTAGTFTITEAETTGWILKSIDCTGSLNSPPVADVSNRFVTIDLAVDGNADCTFTSERDGDFVVERTQTVIRNFMADRLDQIASGDVSLAQRLINRSGRFDLPVNVNGFQLISAGLHELGVRGAGINPLQSAGVETSLHQMQSYQHRQQQAHTAAFDPILPTPGGADADPDESTIAPRFDIWLNARYARVLNEGRSGDFGLIYLGADYLVSPAVLIGGLVQIDLFDQKDDEMNAKTKGTGWLAGPYVVARINEKLLFEGRAAWGMSHNEVNPLAAVSTEFDTRRWLLKGTLTGDIAHDGWRFNPAVSALWMQDSQHNYTDALGITIPGQSVDLGQLSFGSALSREIEWSNGLTVTPRIQLEGVWNFAAPEQVSTAEPLRARLKTGLSVTGFEGLTINASGHLDGIGVDDVLSYGGEIQLSIPLQ